MKKFTILTLVLAIPIMISMTKKIKNARLQQEASLQPAGSENV